MSINEKEQLIELHTMFRRDCVNIINTTNGHFCKKRLKKCTLSCKYFKNKNVK